MEEHSKPVGGGPLFCFKPLCHRTLHLASVRVDVSDIAQVLLDRYRYWNTLATMGAKHGHTDLYQVLKLGLIALILYSSQVYPYVHYHHSHSHTTDPIGESAHPAEDGGRHSHHGHDHDHDHEPQAPYDTHHHNHNFDQHVDWHIVRTHFDRILGHIDVVYTSALPGSESGTDQPLSDCELDLPLLFESIPIGDIDARGPPSLI